MELTAMGVVLTFTIVSTILPPITTGRKLVGVA